MEGEKENSSNMEENKEEVTPSSETQITTISKENKVDNESVENDEVNESKYLSLSQVILVFFILFLKIVFYCSHQKYNRSRCISHSVCH